MCKFFFLFLSLLPASVAYTQTKTEQLDESKKTSTPPNLSKTITLNTEEKAKYLGIYEFSPRFKAQILIVADKMYAQRLGENDKHLLVPIGKHRFFVHDVEQELEFVANEKGDFDKAILHTGEQPMYAPRIATNRTTLRDTIAQLDKTLFDAYNSHDLEKMLSFFSPDLEFFHDLGGLSNFEDNKKAFEENFKAKKKITRTLVENSLEVYPIKDYGAIQVAEHTFCNSESSSEGCSTVKFVHVWQQKNNVWKITRIVSYAH
jgi:ketosteroid isomerase-like protein